MYRYIYLLLLLLATCPMPVVAQKKSTYKVNIAALESKIITPVWAAVPAKGFKNYPGNNLIESICDTITLIRQSQIDSFKILYPGCTSVQILQINGQGASPAITNLDSLNNIQSISQKLKISYTSISSLRGYT